MSGKPYVDYIKNFVASNRPYNEWVEEMLSSTGPMWERGNGGVGYFARDQGMQLDNMSNTARIFSAPVWNVPNATTILRPLDTKTIL